MLVKLGSRIFAPRPFTTLLTAVVLAGLLALGRWQLQRADQKRVLFDEFARGADATQVIDLHTPQIARYRHVEARGSFDSSRQVLIDNMFDVHGRAGYFVITPLALAGGGWLLVNRGWLPLGAQRSTLPSIDVGGSERRVLGRADRLPSPGIRMGTAATPAPPFPVVTNFPTHEDLAQLLGETSWTRAADVVLLDPDQADGFARDWQAPGLPPLRHIAYAVQWFGLALALAVIYVVTNLRRPQSVHGS